MVTLFSALTLTIFILLIRNHLSKLEAAKAAIRKDLTLLDMQTLAATKTIADMTAASLKMEEMSRIIRNSVETNRLMNERLHDPKWMDDFSSGRNNAPWN